MRRVLIKNGTVVTASETKAAGILIDGEKIALVGGEIEDQRCEIIDANGMLVFPGGVDNHTHFDMPSEVANTRGFDTTPAALAGGTTTVVDFAPRFDGMGIAASVDRHSAEHADGISAVDYAFHGIVRADDALDCEIPALPGMGVTTIKLFMAYMGTPYMVDDAQLLRALQLSAKSGVLVMVHAENGHLIKVLEQQCLARGEMAPRYHAVTRPPGVEAEATARAIAIARLAGAPIFLVHVSCQEAVDHIRRAREQGAAVMGETCPHYLALDQGCLSHSGSRGSLYVCSPALRSSEHQDELWRALGDGVLQVVGSDHCGFGLEHKTAYDGDFTRIPNGLPGVQFRLPILWTYGVRAGMITQETMVKVFSTAPARINGLYPQKGHIAPGSDSDLVIFNPRHRSAMGVASSLEGVEYSPYEGMEQRGRVEKVFLRGQLVIDRGRFVGHPGQGRRLACGEPLL